MRLFKDKMNYNDFEKGKTIFVGVDPAAQNIIYSVISNLLQEGWTKEDFSFFTSETEGYVNDSTVSFVKRISFSEQNIEEIFSQSNPSLIFLGTSLVNAEAVWVSKANAKGIKTISFVDHWVNFGKRFLVKDQYCFPTEIWVLNEEAKQQAIQEGLPAEKIKMVRNPYYRFIENYRPEISRTTFYERLGVEKNKTIVFISDPVRDNLPDIGFDEFSTVSVILEKLSELQQENDPVKYNFLIKLHPRCKREKYQEIIKCYQSESIVIKEIGDVDAKMMNYFSDYVIGMFSNMIIEALLMKKKVLRVEINQKTELFKFDEIKCKLVTESIQLKNELYNFLKYD